MLSLVKLYLKLFNELVLIPILNALHRPKRKDEITINININVQESPSPNESRQEKPRVKFGQLEIRTYESILGDNPSCSRGPPVSIGWEHDATKLIAIPADAVEDPHQTDTFDLIMDRTEREETLLHLGYTQAEIASATRQGMRDKQKRRQTTDNLKVSYAEEKLEGFKKCIRRKLLMKKSTKAMYKSWKKDNIDQPAKGPINLSTRGHSHKAGGGVLA